MYEIKEMSVTDLKGLATGDEQGARRVAWAELHERAEAGDAAAKKAIAAIEKGGGLEPGGEELAEGLAGAEGLTLPGIADRIHDELVAVLLEAPLDLVTADGSPVPDTRPGRIRDLAAAFRDVDAVLARVRAEQPVGGLGPDTEQVLGVLWQAVNEIPERDLAATDNRAQLADILVGRLRAKLTGA